jgi:hypothetical protein
MSDEQKQTADDIVGDDVSVDGNGNDPAPAEEQSKEPPKEQSKDPAQEQEDQAPAEESTNEEPAKEAEQATEEQSTDDEPSGYLSPEQILEEFKQDPNTKHLLGYLKQPAQPDDQGEPDDEEEAPEDRAARKAAELVYKKIAEREAAKEQQKAQQALNEAAAKANTHVLEYRKRMGVPDDVWKQIRQYADAMVPDELFATVTDRYHGPANWASLIVDKVNAWKQGQLARPAGPTDKQQQQISSAQQPPGTGATPKPGVTSEEERNQMEADEIIPDDDPPV